MKTNTFQKFMLKADKSGIIWDIVKLYHPMTPDEYESPYNKGVMKKTLDSISVYSKYDWICIEGHGISIGIEFPNTHNGQTMFGTGWKLSHFEESLKHDKFKCWRFARDSAYVDCATVFKDKSKDNCPDINYLLERYNVPKPTAKEMCDFYYED